MHRCRRDQRRRQDSQSLFYASQKSCYESTTKAQHIESTNNIRSQVVSGRCSNRSTSNCDLAGPEQTPSPSVDRCTFFADVKSSHRILNSSRQCARGHIVQHSSSWNSLQKQERRVTLVPSPAYPPIQPRKPDTLTLSSNLHNFTQSGAASSDMAPSL